MPTIMLERSLVLVVDFQTRLTPAIAEAETRLKAARTLLGVAALLGAPVVATEQNPAGLGATVAGLLPAGAKVLAKRSFDATRAPGFAAAVAGDRDILLMGAETHVCVLQTALSLLASGRRVCVVADAVGSRRAADREAALARMAREGAEIVTAEMAIFEWLESCDHPRFRDAMRFVR